MKENLSRLLFVLLTFLLHTLCDEDGLVVLNDDNFEHLTQAATGATTGDWLVFMVKSGKCKECEHIEKELKTVAIEFRNRLNVAKLDPDNSRLTLRRFKIQKKPTILFFRLGYQWRYTKRISSQDISRFVSEGYGRENAYPVAKQLDRFDVWQEDYVKEMKERKLFFIFTTSFIIQVLRGLLQAAWKERRLPERSALLVTLAGLVVGLVLLSCMLPSKTKQTEEKSKKKRR